MTRRPRLFRNAVVSLALWTSSAQAYNAQTHQDISAYAYELMVVASSAQLRQALAPEPELVAFAEKLAAAAKRLDQLPANLPPVHQDSCIDLDVLKRFGDVRPHWPSDLQRVPMSRVTYPIDVQYVSNDKSCGVNPDWRPGLLYRHQHEAAGTHTGSVLGFWAAHPDDLLNDVRLQVRPTNIAPINALKVAIESAGGVAAGTVWIPLKCAGSCLNAVLDLDFDECKKCVSDAIDEGRDTVHDGVATVDGWFPGIGEFKDDMIVGMCHHIDMKDELSAPGWSPIPKQRYDDVSGLYALTAGPFGVPGLIEWAAIGASQVGVSINYDESDSVKNYQVADGRDAHENTRVRSKSEWEYLNWPFIPMTPVDNLGWFGWDRFRSSRQAVKANSAEVLQSKYLGWALHALGDATVPMHTVSTFAWGHRPYEDAVEELGRGLLGGDDFDRALLQAVQVLRAARGYRAFIDDWRAAHPDRPGDIPVRGLVTQLARRTFTEAMAAPSVFNDAASSLWLVPLSRGASVEGYKAFAPSMQRNVLDAVAASVALLSAVVEETP